VTQIAVSANIVRKGTGFKRTVAMNATRTERVEGDEPNTRMNALVGAVVAIVTAPLLPFAALVGGGVAGYLQQGDVNEGARVGAYAGGIAAIPAVLGVFIVGGFLVGAASLSQVFFAPVLALFALLVVPVYYLVAGGVGGAVGSYLHSEL